MFFILSWRNIWRNPRRTTVIMTAVVIGVWSMIVLGALSRGSMNQMVANGIKTLTGHIQIHEKDFRNDPVVAHRMDHPEAIAAVLRKMLPPGSRWTDRVKINAVVSNARHATGLTIVGIEPAAERRMSFIGDAVTEGRYLGAGDGHGILIGRSMVDKFQTRLGHKLVVMAQDTSGNIASRAFRIVGIYHAEMESTEKTYAFITRSAAQEMLGMGHAVSEFSILLPENSPKAVTATVAALRHDLPKTVSVTSWYGLLPLINAYVQLMGEWLLIWYVVVFIAMGFGLVNTLLMAVYERMREFGLLKALGMKPSWIVSGVTMEALIVIVLGLVAGNLVGLGTVAVAARHGIDLSAVAKGAEFAGISRIIYPVAEFKDVFMANAVVLLLGLLVSLYPAAKAARFTPIEAMMQH